MKTSILLLLLLISPEVENLVAYKYLYKWGRERERYANDNVIKNLLRKFHAHMRWVQMVVAYALVVDDN